MTILVESRQPETSPRVNLYSLDLSMFGQSNLNFYVGFNEADTDGAIYFNSIKYYPANINAEGFDWNGKGQPPSPKLSLSTINIDGTSNALLLSLINDYNNLQGAKFTRIRTFQKYLDGNSDSGSAVKAFVSDIFTIDRKSLENKYAIEFELSSVIDQTNATLPKNIVSASYCPWKYRYRNSDNTAWVYILGDDTCPYVGANMYTLDGTLTTNPLLDKASKQFNTCCKPRFGIDAIYPFGGFPGAGRANV